MPEDATESRVGMTRSPQVETKLLPSLVIPTVLSNHALTWNVSCITAGKHLSPPVTTPPYPFAGSQTHW